MLPYSNTRYEENNQSDVMESDVMNYFRMTGQKRAHRSSDTELRLACKKSAI